MGDEIRSKLLEALNRKALREGDFTLASGAKSDYYIDCKEVTLDGEGSLLVGRAIYKLIKPWNVSAVGGMELGSVPISTAVCLVSALEGTPLSNFIVRKQAKGHGTGKRLEGKITKGDTVVIVEDVVTTGGSSVKAVSAVQDAGACVAVVVAIVDREMGGAEVFAKLGIRFVPLFTISELRSAI